MKKYLLVITVAIFLTGLVLTFGIQPTEAFGIPGIDFYVQGAYNYEFEEAGPKVGAKFDKLPLLSLQVDGTYYSNDIYALRGSGAYNLIPGPILDVKLLGGVGFYNNDDSEFDGHLGLQLEQGTGVTDIKLKADVIIMPGIFSDLDSHVEVAAGFSRKF